MADINPFARYAYSNIKYTTDNADIYKNENSDKFTFTGGDLTAYVGTKKIGNLESITWSISVEIVGNYVMGRRDAVAYNNGKRVIVGSMVLSQYDRHALLAEVFGFTPGANTYKDIWDKMYREGSVGAFNGRSISNVANNALIGTNVAVNATTAYVASPRNFNSELNSPAGIAPSVLNQRLEQMLNDTVERVGAQKISYSDQLPSFDMTLIGVNKAGAAARAAIQGMYVTQETGGFSNNDLGNAVGFSFTALRIDHWRQIENTTASNAPPLMISE